MNQTMRMLSSFQVQNKKNSFKYAYAFMSCKNLYVKECSFLNPNPKQIDSEHVLPRDAFSAMYSESNLPPWEEFSSSQIHLSAPSFTCVGSLDRSDTKRLMCSSFGSKILFCCYGNYEEQAQKMVTEILSIVQTLK
jgi:hypothetical protein